MIHFFLHLAKSTDNESVPNSTVEDGPGDGFTILSAKSLFLGQKVIDKMIRNDSLELINVKVFQVMTCV